MLVASAIAPAIGCTMWTFGYHVAFPSRSSFTPHHHQLPRFCLGLLTVEHRCVHLRSAQDDKIYRFSRQSSSKKLQVTSIFEARTLLTRVDVALDSVAHFILKLSLEMIKTEGQQHVFPAATADHT